MRIECADIGDSQSVNEELGKLEDARQNRLGPPDKRGVFCGACHFGVMIADHRYARCGGNTDDFRIRKYVDEVAHHAEGFHLVPSVVVHLTAASLSREKFYRVAEALEDCDNRFTGLGK
jgi:hypothetical protein